MFKKVESDGKTKYDTFYSNLKAKTIINESKVADVFEPFYTTIISNMQTYLGKFSDWIIDSIIDHNINISKYNALAGSTYIKLPNELDNSRKDLISIQNIDDNQ